MLMQEANVGLIIPIFASFVTLQCRFSQRLRAIVNVLTSNTYLALLCVAAGNTRNEGDAVVITTQLTTVVYLAPSAVDIINSKLIRSLRFVSLVRRN